MLMNPVTGGVDHHQITIMGGGYAAIRRPQAHVDACPSLSGEVESRHFHRRTFICEATFQLGKQW